MICYVCQKDNWKSLGDINPQKELRVCAECGNAAYNIGDMTDEKIKKYYKTEYRDGPTFMNLVTTNHKLNYIKIALAEFLKDKKGLIVGDVGAATGYLVKWFAEIGHKAYGSEYGLKFRRFSEHFYGHPMHEELPENPNGYDLITMYHTLEHMLLPDEKLKKYVGMLKPDGHMFISCPEWLDTLEEASGSPITSFEHLFHKDHINVFTRQSLKNLFARAGLEIVREDHQQYGQSYIVKRTGKIGEVVKENPEEVIEKIKKCKEAINHYKAGRNREATKSWNKFPEAWMRIILQENAKDEKAQDELWEECLGFLGENIRFCQSYALWLYSHERFEDCVKLLDKLMGVRPNEDYMLHIAHCLNFLGHGAKAMQAFHRAAQMNPFKFQEPMSFACSVANNLLTWDERAEREVKEKLFKEHQEKENG